MGKSCRLSAIATGLCLLTFGPLASAQVHTFNVDCSKGQKISTALQHGDARKPLVVVVSGTCNENVEITRDDVTLRGNSSKLGIVAGTAGTPTILVRASRILIDQLKVRGGFYGIQLVGGSNIAITKSDVQYSTTSSGINITGSSAVTVQDTVVQHSGQSGITLNQANVEITGSRLENNSGSGLYVRRRSSVSITGSSVATNPTGGIVARDNSEVLIEDSTISGNATNPNALGNYRAGVAAVSSTVTITNSTVKDNGFNGVQSVGGGTLSVQGGTITNNMGWGIVAYQGTLANIGGPITASGNLNGDLLASLDVTVVLGGTGGATTIPNINVDAASTLWVTPASGGPTITAAVNCSVQSRISFNTRITGPVNNCIVVQ